MIVVIGAGPAGLVTAYYLQKHCLPYRILERQAIGCAWRHHYERLHLNTLRQVSALPGLPMPRDYPRFPSAGQYVAYLESYVRHFNLPVEVGVEVQRLEYNSGWQVETNQGAVAAETLVLATGIWSTPYYPVFGGEADFGGPILHSRDYRNAAVFQGKRVLVVGVGNSGAEIAADLGEHGVTVGIAIREGCYFVPRTESVWRARIGAWLYRHFPRALAMRLLRDDRPPSDFRHLGLNPPAVNPLDTNPVVGFALPQAVAAGWVTVYPCVGRFQPGGVQFVDGREVAFDAVILATGYRPTIGLASDALEVDPRGYPILKQGRSTRNPHLFCVGFTYPTTEGFLQSVPRAARLVVKQIAQHK